MASQEKITELCENFKNKLRDINQNASTFSEWATGNGLNLSRSMVSNLMTGKNINPDSRFYTLNDIKKTHMSNFEKAIKDGWLPKKSKEKNSMNKETTTYAIRDQRATGDFIEKELHRLKDGLPEGEMIKIDAVGVKLSSFRKKLEEFHVNRVTDMTDLFPRLQIRCLVLEPRISDDPKISLSGMELRVMLEERKAEDFVTILDGAIGKLKTVNGIVRSYYATDSVQSENAPYMKLKLLRPAPNAYIIRIHDVLLTGTYYAKKGNLSPYTVIRKTDSEMAFESVLGLFNRYWKGDLSKEVDD